MTKNDEVWHQLFDKYSILDHLEDIGKFQISAERIKEFYEPRLATKFDHQDNLPAVFREHGLSILPISRGEYVLGRFDAYSKFDPAVTTIKELPTLDLESLNPSNITSESAALNYAHAAGALQDFTGEDSLISTVNGRMGSGKFEFGIEGKLQRFDISVNGSQIEIDAGFEGRNSLVLVEAKNHIEDTFLVRQIYYPFRSWSDRVNKRVRNLYATWVNGALTLREYEFADPFNYSSIELVKSVKYVTPSNISYEDIYRIVSSASPVRDFPTSIPYPQADSFERVINLIELCALQPLTPDAIAANYDFTMRQVDYYTNAARFIGMLEKQSLPSGIYYSLSTRGSSLATLSHREKQIALVKALAEDMTIRTCILESIRRRKLVERSYIESAMRKNGLQLVETTIKRRAQTIEKWVAWVLALVN